MIHDKHLSRWTVVTGALIVQVILGTVYAFSVFVKPLEAEFLWSRTTTQWAFSFALASFALAMIPAGRLQDHIGPRKVASIGGILLGLSFLLAAFVVTKERPWALYLTYGLIGGAGIGCAWRGVSGVVEQGEDAGLGGAEAAYQLLVEFVAG